LAVSVGSAQADWIKHEGHAAKGQGVNVAKVYFNQVKHSDLDGFVTACKTKCDENSDTCGGFILNYANTDKTRPAICVFKGEDFSLVDMPTKDFYQVVTHDEVLALLEQLVTNLNTEEVAKLVDSVTQPHVRRLSASSSKDGEQWVEGKGNACWDQDYADGAGKGNGWVVGAAKAKHTKLTQAQVNTCAAVMLEYGNQHGWAVARTQKHKLNCADASYDFLKYFVYSKATFDLSGHMCR